MCCLWGSVKAVKVIELTEGLMRFILTIGSQREQFRRRALCWCLRCFRETDCLKSIDFIEVVYVVMELLLGLSSVFFG